MGLKKEQPSQRRFIPVNGGLELESDHDFGVRRSVSNLPLVRELGGAPIQMIDLRDGERRKSVVDPHSWNERKRRGKKAAGALIRTRGPVSEEQISEALSQVKNDGGVLIIVEEGSPLSSGQREERKRLLGGKIRLAKIVVSNREVGLDDEVTISEARKRRTPKRRKPVDINKTKSRFTVKKRLAQVRQAEQEGGAIEVDDSEARKLMAGSSNLRRDAARLGDGGGRVVREACGCEVRHSLNGTTTVINNCNGGDNCSLRGSAEKRQTTHLTWDDLLKQNHLITRSIQRKKPGATFRDDRGHPYRVVEAEVPDPNSKGTFKVIKVAVKVG